MKTLQATATVDAQHRVTIQLPPDIEPGEHRLTIVVDEAAEPQNGQLPGSSPRPPLTFSAHDVGPWPEGFTVRREEIYGDDGR